MSDLKYADALCRTENPLDWTESQRRTFVAATRELALYNFEASPDIRGLYQKHGFDPSSIESEDDIARIPPLSVTAMKHMLFLSKDEDQAVLKLTSSGTSGQKTQIWFDQESLDRVQATLDRLWQQEGLRSEKRTNYLMFVHNPEKAQDLGIAFSCKNAQRHAPPHETVYAIDREPGEDWRFQRERCWETLKRFAAQKLPVRIIGIPSFMYDLVKNARKTDRLSLPPGSLLMTGGGWKAAENEKISLERFRALMSEFLGLPLESIRDGYGMAEHSAPYTQCKHHRLHVPAFARVLVRHPVTLEVLPPGEVGLLELVCPFNTMMPNLALLTTDMGMLDPTPCPCGANAPTFSLVGRAGLSKHKGCAITAGEILKRE
ncbi:MAG: hypothetical protein AAFY60_08145 [Myxococcota bacterium]